MTNKTASPKSTLLGGLTAKEFLRDYWQKKPLLIRGAVPGFGTELGRDGLLELATRDDVESRYVAHDASHWDLGRGPFSKAEQSKWKGAWTVLVQGMNLVLPAGDDLLRQFSFIPYARLDDLMVSYATDGAGVGPHIDNYDVFLLQGIGRRRWRIGKQRDTRLIEGAPLKILRHFKPEFDWVLEPGDMLYLPPDWAHDGTAVGECMTWSIGFRTSPAQELGEQFLGFLQDHLAQNPCLEGRYADPDLALQKHPAEISKTMIQRTTEMLAAIDWDHRLVRDFLGTQLTEPKPQVFFDPPEKPMSEAKFLTAANKHGLRLDRRARLLFADGRFYINGETADVTRINAPLLKWFADERGLPADALTHLTSGDEALAMLHEWYCCGFVHTDN